MSYNFPDSPTVGQVFVPVNGPSWTWTGSAWAATQSKTPTADSYNRVVNGAMQHSQENGNTGATAAASGTWYPADQFLCAWSVATGTLGAARFQSASLPNNDANYIGVFTTTGVTFTAGSYASINQRIEGNRVADLNWGTASARQAVVRFWAFSTLAGNYTFSIQNAASDRSYLASYTLAASTWTPVTLVIPGDTTGTWAKDNTVGIMLQWQLGTGSTFTGVAGWQAGNKNNLSGSANAVASANTGLNIMDAGIYADPNNTGVAPPWVTPDFASELQACLRYWESGSSRWDGMATSAVLASTQIWFKAWKRIAPTMSGASTSAVSFPATPNYSSANSSNCLDYRTANASAAGSFSSTWIANARM